MGRYSKIYSTYILRKKHQNINDGVIWERDWVTTGSKHRLEPGKKPYYSDYGFMFTDNALPFFKKKHDYGKWVAHFIYDNVKDATSDVNIVKVNNDSDDFRSYAYYGSAEDLIKGSVENIIKYFPGRITPTGNTLTVQDFDGSWIDTGKTILNNPFELDLVTQTVSVADFGNELRYLTSSWFKYNIVTIDVDGNRINVSPIIEYIVENAEGEILNSSRYHDMGYDYIRYKDTLFKWDETEGKFIKISYTDGCQNYFIMCDEYIRQGDDYYMWDYGEGHYQPLVVLEICNDNYMKIFTITIKTENGREYYLDMYRINGSNVYCTYSLDVIIEPKEDVIDSYFDNLEGFEHRLLTRKSRPFYRNTFKVPYELSNGSYVLVNKTFTWPSNDYCIDIESMAYTSFLNDILDAAELYDQVYSDCIWRCMTHESIKNFDWTYRREYTENDAQDNIEGGERMMEVLRFYGRIYDEAKRYVDGIRMTNNISYNGYNNLPDAEISDRNDIMGWDIASTIWEPYYYMQNDDIPEGFTAVPYPTLPDDVTIDSPEWISVGCEGNSTYYHREYNDPSLEFLTDEFLNDEEYIIGNENPWIRCNHNMGYINIGCNLPDGATYEEMDHVPVVATLEDPKYILVDGDYYRKSCICYVDVSANSIPGGSDYCWDDSNTYTSLPSIVTSSSPRYIRIVSGSMYRYYALSDSGFDSSRYLHNRWYEVVNPNLVTPASSDIDFQRRLHISTNRIFKTKGTRHSIDMVMSLFGLSENDYSITEFYNYANPVKADDVFYFYDELTDEPAGVIWIHSINFFDSLDDAISLLGPSAPQYIKVETGGVDFYYELNDEYTYEEMIVELYRHKDADRLYNDVYTGTPINEIMIGNDKYIIPFYTQKRIYDGYLYFQQKGGWGKKSYTNFQYDYSETVPYLHLIPNVESLMSIISNDLSEDDVYYVFDTSDYVNFDEDVPFNLSHFFKIHDMYNPQRFSSWRNIPMDGEIVYNTNYNQNDVTHEDYLHAKYLNDIIPTIYYNNPHTGIGKYDMGKEYFEYMKAPYKYIFENYAFDDSRYINIAKQFLFTVTELVANENNEKFSKWLDTVSYAYNSGTLEETINTFDSSRYFLNNKLIILRNNHNNTFHKKFLRNVVLKYVFQVIPSTTILVLENFDTSMDTDNMHYYTVTTYPNDVTYGETSGDGTYLDTTYAVLRATEYDGYHFVRWERVFDEESVLVSNEPVTQVMVCDDSEYVAIFEEDCYLNAYCDTTCEILVGCEEVENCTTTLLCEVEEYCGITTGCIESDCETEFSFDYQNAATLSINGQTYRNDTGKLTVTNGDAFTVEPDNNYYITDIINHNTGESVGECTYCYNSFPIPDSNGIVRYYKDINYSDIPVGATVTEVYDRRFILNSNSPQYVKLVKPGQSDVYAILKEFDLNNPTIGIWGDLCDSAFYEFERYNDYQIPDIINSVSEASPNFILAKGFDVFFVKTRVNCQYKVKCEGKYQICMLDGSYVKPTKDWVTVASIPQLTPSQEIINVNWGDYPDYAHFWYVHNPMTEYSNGKRYAKIDTDRYFLQIVDNC